MVYAYESIHTKDWFVGRGIFVGGGSFADGGSFVGGGLLVRAGFFVGIDSASWSSGGVEPENPPLDPDDMM